MLRKILIRLNISETNRKKPILLDQLRWIELGFKNIFKSFDHFCGTFFVFLTLMPMELFLPHFKQILIKNSNTVDPSKQNLTIVITWTVNLYLQHSSTNSLFVKLFHKFNKRLLYCFYLFNKVDTNEINKFMTSTIVLWYYWKHFGSFSKYSIPTSYYYLQIFPLFISLSISSPSKCS